LLRSSRILLGVWLGLELLLLVMLVCAVLNGPYQWSNTNGVDDNLREHFYTRYFFVAICVSYLMQTLLVLVKLSAAYSKIVCLVDSETNSEGSSRNLCPNSGMHLYLERKIFIILFVVPYLSIVVASWATSLLTPYVNSSRWLSGPLLFNIEQLFIQIALAGTVIHVSVARLKPLTRYLAGILIIVVSVYTSYLQQAVKTTLELLINTGASKILALAAWFVLAVLVLLPLFVPRFRELRRVRNS
jgi:hypothetical protein